jgi:5,10-methylenetetrahydromethanopterin reductase
VSARVSVAFDGIAPVASAVALAREAEAAGLHAMWLAEHVGYRESTVTALAVSAATSRLTAIPTALTPYLHAPVVAAMALATLAEAAPGRIAAAVGLGNPLALRESGVEPRHPVRAVGDYVDALRGLLRGDTVHQAGEVVRLAGARLGFTPPPVPLHVAAIRERMLALAGRDADGVVLSAGLTTAYTAASLARVQVAARAAGRDPNDVLAAGYVITAVSADGRTAVEAARAKLAFLLRNTYLADNVRTAAVPVDQDAIAAAVARRDLEAARRLVSDDAVEAFTAAGTPAACRARLERYLDAGLREIVLSVAGAPEGRALALGVAREFVDA